MKCLDSLYNLTEFVVSNMSTESGRFQYLLLLVEFCLAMREGSQKKVL